MSRDPGGPLQALLVGLPHPEEPVGTLALEYGLPLLADGLVASRFNFSVIKAGDPDATLLNEPWFDDPYDLTGFLLRVYRPPLHDQVRVDVPDELQTLRLHTASAGGGGGDEGHRPPPARLLHAAAQLHVRLVLPSPRRTRSSRTTSPPSWRRQVCRPTATAGVPYLRQLAPGIFRGFGLAEDYEFYEAYGADPAVVLDFGTSSDDYAEAMWDCFTLVSEVAYFTSPRIADQSPAGLTRREAKLRGLEVQEQLALWLHERYVEATTA